MMMMMVVSGHFKVYCCANTLTDQLYCRTNICCNHDSFFGAGGGGGGGGSFLYHFPQLILQHRKKKLGFAVQLQFCTIIQAAVQYF